MIPVVDLFAGPGGSGEGFAVLTRADGGRVFSLNLSIEKDEHAHRTLELRSFFRKFAAGRVPDEYYDDIRGQISRDDLFRRFPDTAEAAKREAWRAELGGPLTSYAELDGRIRDAVRGQSRWVLLGGPPCQAYSLAGRSRIIGAKARCAYERDPRLHLYREYLRVVAVHEPAAFVMENVKGLLSTKIRDCFLFKRIIDELRDPKAAVLGSRDESRARYRILSLHSTAMRPIDEPSYRDCLVRSEDFGIPQKRHRVIIVGLRSDIPVRTHTFEKKVDRPSKI